VLGSIQGLRQRLGAFSFDDVSAAEADVRSLINRLIAMRDKLNDMAQLKQAVVVTHRRIHEIPEPNFDLVNFDGLEKHPQLHAIVQAGKLIRFHRLMKAAQASADAVTFDSESNTLHIAESAAPDDLAPSGRETVALMEEREIALERNLTENDPQANKADAAPMVSIATTPPELNENISIMREETSLATSSEENFTVQIDQDGNLPTEDWTFDLDEASPIVDETSGASANFVFPDEHSSDQKPSPHDSSTIILPPPGVSLVEAYASIASASPHPDDSGEPLTSEDHLETKTRGGQTKADRSDSKAQTPIDSNFDHRLLDELIKNYGDFTAGHNLAAAPKTGKPAKPTYDSPAVETSPVFDAPMVSKRKAGNMKKSGDLDRQLKKIIKDYGENDLYPRQSLVNLKTGGIAAFALLALVLGGLSLFKASNAPRPAQVRSVAMSAEIQKAAPTETAVPNNSVGINGSLAGGPEAANASTDSPTEDKQKP
jgi:hypothetical protein